MKPINTSAEFITRLSELYDENIEISRKKNNDYGGNTDPFNNFTLSARFGVDPAKAILVRMSDKMARLATGLDRELLVSDESIYDTCSDLANYAMILRMYLENEKSKEVSHL